MSAPRNKWIEGIRQIFKMYRLSGKEKVIYAGKDHLGNKYYEEERPNSFRRRYQRYFVREGIDYNKDPYMIDFAYVPPAWNAWLRFRRAEPPSEEELRESEEYFNNQQKMATERKLKEQQDESQDLAIINDGNQGRSSNAQQKSRDFPKLPKLDR